MGCELWENSFGWSICGYYYSVCGYPTINYPYRGKVEMPPISLMENGLIIFQFCKEESRDWFLLMGLGILVEAHSPL